MSEAELDLWRRCRRGEQGSREKLIEFLTKKYKPLVDSIARRVVRLARWTNIEDLRQEGNIAIIGAIDRFDPEAGREFGAFARKAIRGAIARNPEVTRGLKRHYYENYRKARDAQDHLSQALNRKPTPEELAKEAGLTVEQVQDALSAINLVLADSASASDPEDPFETTNDGLENLAAGTPDIDRRILAQEALKELSQDHQDIVIDYYWNDLTDAQIAKKHGLRGDTVRQRRRAALKRLRRLIEGK